MSRHRSVISRRWLLAAALLLVPASALAQVASGVIVGTIRDPAGDPLPGTSVEVMNEGTGRRRLTVTEADGSFQKLFDQYGVKAIDGAVAVKGPAG